MVYGLSACGVLSEVRSMYRGRRLGGDLRGSADGRKRDKGRGRVTAQLDRAPRLQPLFQRQAGHSGDAGSWNHLNTAGHIDCGLGPATFQCIGLYVTFLRELLGFEILLNLAASRCADAQLVPYKETSTC